MIGLDVLSAAGLLTLAANPITCTVPKAPVVTVKPVVNRTRMVESQSITELGQHKADTISPYGKHVEQLVFGLHEGSLGLASATKIGYRISEWLELSCLYYDSVKVEIRLNPVIYVVREFRPGSCAYNAVLAHEKKHAAVDRAIVQKYAPLIGKEVQKAVNAAGALGPYPIADMKSVQDRMLRHIETAVSSLELQMTEDQARRQQDVDSLEEYQYVSTYIRDICKIDTGAFSGTKR